jgi:hypothetical protein
LGVGGKDAQALFDYGLEVRELGCRCKVDLVQRLISASDLFLELFM